jgi:integrase
MRMKKDNIGHNNPPLELEDFIIKDKDGKSTGRIKFTNTFLKKYLTKKYIPERDVYVERVINDSEKIGLKAKATVGGSISLFYQYLPKGKNYPIKYLLGKFPEMSVDAARKLVDDLKHAIKLGQDPKSVIAERMRAKTLNQVVDEWKNKVLFKSARFATSTVRDTEQRLKNWIHLSAISPKTNKIIFNNRKDLNIGAMKMVEITKDDLIAWHAAVSKTGEPQGNRCVDDLKVIFKWALEQKIIKENICKFSYTELNEKYTRLDDKDPYSRDEWRMLRKSALKLIKKNPRIKLACMGILLAMYTGRRYKSEILSLKWSQVDWDANKVRLPKTKTGKSEFSVNKLTRWVLNTLWKYREQKYKGKKNKSVKAGYLFPSIRKSKKPYIQDIRKTWTKVCGIANVRLEEPYLLRHTWGCLALEATNGNFAAVKDEGGWKTFEMVEVYAKYNKRKLSQQSQVIGNFLAHARA